MLTLFGGLMLFGWIGSLRATVEASHARHAARIPAQMEETAHRRRQAMAAQRDAGRFGEASANRDTVTAICRTRGVAVCWLGPSRASPATLRLSVQARTRKPRRTPRSRRGRGRA